MMLCVQYLTAHLQRVVREGVAAAVSAATGNDSLPSSPTPPESKQVFYAKYCLRHIAAPRTRTRKLPPSSVELEVERPLLEVSVKCVMCVNVLNSVF